MTSPKTFLYGAFPPPIHGLANVNAALFEFLSTKGLRIVKLDVARPTLVGGVFVRLWRTIQSIFQILLARGYVNVVVALSSGSGLVLDLIFISVCRMRGHRICFYYHNFSLVDTRRLLVRSIVWLQTSSDCNVFLCNEMNNRFKTIYYSPASALVVSNLCWMSLTPIEADDQSNQVTIGYLGALSVDKGYPEFVRLSNQMKGRMGFKFISAGPLQIEMSADDLRNIEYFGVVVDKAKSDFLNNIDILIFSSNYRHEAQPLVVFEALAAGVHVLAFNIGCTGELASWQSATLTNSYNLLLDLEKLVNRILPNVIGNSRIQVRRAVQNEFLEKFELAEQGKQRLLRWFKDSV